MIAISIPVSVLGLVGNAFVISFLSFMFKKTRFTLYILNISVGDSGILIYLITYFILFLIPNVISPHVSYVIELLYALGYKSSFYILTALCLERYLSQFSPTWYQSHRPEYISVFIFITLWTFSGLISLLHYFACYPRFYIYLSEITLFCMTVNIFQLVLEFLILIPIMVFSTVSIFIRMKKKAQHTPPVMLDISIIATVVLFLVFDVSVKIFNAIEFWFDAIHVPTFSVAVLFDCISSSINPYAYVFIGWYRTRSFLPFEAFLEEALQDERTVAEGI